MHLVELLVALYSVVVFVRAGLSSAQHREFPDYCSTGTWERVPHERHPYDQLYTRVELGQANATDKQNIQRCPWQNLANSCYYMAAGPRRASDAENRLWKAKDGKCLSFFPRDFLSIVSNRTLCFLGDSVSIQIFTGLLCALRQSVQLSDLHWHKYSPFLEGGQIFVKATKTRIAIRYSGGKFIPGEMPRIISKLNLGERDVLVLNAGLHFNRQDVYRRVLTENFEKISEMKNKTPQVAMPHLLFLETTPQHFHSENGYFFEKNEFRTLPSQCGIHNQSSLLSADEFTAKMTQGDWRNVIAEEVVKSHNSTCLAHIVRIAAPLYAQHDAHIERNGTDCTHWCEPSAIFPFIHRSIFNKLLDVLELRDTFEADRSQGVLAYPTNTLLRGASNPTVYVVRDNKRHAFKSKEEFIAGRFDFNRVRVVDEEELMDIAVAKV